MRKTKVKVAVAFEYPHVGCWPCIDFDAQKETQRIMEPITALNPNMDFDVAMYNTRKEAEADYPQDLLKYDGVLVLLMTTWKQIDIFYIEQSRSGIPTIVADVPLCGSGSALGHASPAIREGNYPVPLLSTLDYSELAVAVRAFDVIAKMKQTTILVISNDVTEKHSAPFEQAWGCKFVHKSSADIVALSNTVARSDALPIAQRWMREAAEVKEPTEEDVIESAIFHLAIKQMMQDVGADAVTLDCLSLPYFGSYDANARRYPCMSHYEMLNHGTVAVCEADLPATVTSLIVQYLTGRPGFVSDPAIDTSSNQILYAHCVGCTKVFGKDDPRRCKFVMRSHAEDNKGTSVQIIFPANEDVTTLMIYPGSAVIHSGRSVGNVGLQEGCRSKLAAEANTKALLRNWNGAWHRVTVFGDYREALMQLCLIKGIRVQEEDVL